MSAEQTYATTPIKSILFLFWISFSMFELLRFVALIGFNPSGPESADRMASDDGTCDDQYVRVVSRRASKAPAVGAMKSKCADGNQPGRWDPPTFTVTATSEEMSGNCETSSYCKHLSTARQFTDCRNEGTDTGFSDEQVLDARYAPLAAVPLAIDKIIHYFDG